MCRRTWVWIPGTCIQAGHGSMCICNSGTEDMDLRGSLGGVSWPASLVWDPGLNRSPLSKYGGERLRETPSADLPSPQVCFHKYSCMSTFIHTEEMIRPLLKTTGWQKFTGWSSYISRVLLCIPHWYPLTLFSALYTNLLQNCEVSASTSRSQRNLSSLLIT